MFQDECTLRVDICGRLADDRKQLVAARDRALRMRVVDSVHIGLGSSRSAPLNKLRASLAAVAELINELGASQVQLSGASLLIPGTHQDHLPLQFVDDAVVGAVSEIKSKILVLSIDPVRAGSFLDKTHYHVGRAYGILDLARLLQYRCVGVISAEPDFERTQAHLVKDVMGPDFQDCQSLYRAYLSLFTGLHSIVDTTGKPLYCGNGTPQESRNGPISKPPAKRRPPKVGGSALASARALVADVCASGALNRLEIVELMLVAAGAKSSMRTSTKPHSARKIAEVLSAHGLSYSLNCEKRRYRADRGKGGWSNLCETPGDGSASSREVMLYVATSARLAAQTAEAEDEGDQQFGEVLSYPACCRASFARNLPIAARHQGDLTPLIVDQTLEPGPWPFLLNTAARYFMYQVVSYYPCSYACVEAARQAREYYQVICDIVPDWGRELAAVMASPALYTEYRGVYLFGGAQVAGNRMTFSGDAVRMTTDNSLGRALRASDTLVECGPGEVALYRGSKCVKVLKDANIRLMPFGGGQR